MQLGSQLRYLERELSARVLSSVGHFVQASLHVLLLSALGRFVEINELLLRDSRIEMRLVVPPLANSERWSWRG